MVVSVMSMTGARSAGARKWWALAGLTLGVLAVGLDATVLSVALPTLAVSLHASATDLRPGQEIRISLREERVTVEKRPVVTEEVTVGKRVVQEIARVGGEVRKEEVRVERQGDVRVCDGATVTK